jgi:predicted branched-subunit amino acid permease
VRGAYGPAVPRRGLTRWADAPRRVRGVAVATVLLLAYGTVVHVVQLLGAGLAPYPRLPGWLRAYFIGLTVLDPLAAVLLARARRSGVVLSVAVLVTDAAANAWANWVVDTSAGVTLGRVGTAVITVLALLLLAAARPLWLATGPRP